MSDDVDPKRQLRRSLRSRRQATDPEERLRASAAVAQLLHQTLHDVELLGAFAAHDNEIDLAPFYSEWLRSRRRLAFPRVVASPDMVFCEITDLGQLVPGAFGIREPTTPPIDAPLIDAFLVPAVAFDRSGNRLGFGGGYYDRLLGSVLERAETIPIRIGIGYSWQLLEDDLPSDPWDVRMNRIVTDVEIWSAETSG